MFRLLFLGNGWADCVKIWYALGNPLATYYAVVTDGVSLHVCTCTPRFCISQTARPIVFKLDVWVSSHYLSAFVTGFRVGLPVSVEHRSLSVCSAEVGHRGTHRPLHNWAGQ